MEGDNTDEEYEPWIGGGGQEMWEPSDTETN